MSSLSIKAIVPAIVLFAAIAFAAPADAAKMHKHVRHISPAAAAAMASAHSTCRGADLFPCGPLYYSGTYLGDDPDPFIRSQIWRDIDARFGGNN